MSQYVWRRLVSVGARYKWMSKLNRSLVIPGLLLILLLVQLFPYVHNLCQNFSSWQERRRNWRSISYNWWQVPRNLFAHAYLASLVLVLEIQSALLDQHVKKNWSNRARPWNFNSGTFSKSFKDNENALFLPGDNGKIEIYRWAFWGIDGWLWN